MLDTTQPTSSAAGLCSVYTVMRSCVLVLSGYNRACNEVGDGETVHINSEVITGWNLKGLSTEFLCEAPASGLRARVHRPGPQAPEDGARLWDSVQPSWRVRPPGVCCGFSG